MSDAHTAASPVGSWADQIIDEVTRSYLGNRQAIQLALVALLCRGHVLIEDLPGVGKTVLARAFAQSLGGRFRQIQCTPDLLPTDILGVSIYHQATSEFRFREGPIMTNTLLVDEINRATPRTQSALLEAMAEGQVSIESKTMKLPDPFFLVATQSPLESEGTFPLPEVQKDRFFLTLSLGYPGREEEARIIADWGRRELGEAEESASDLSGVLAMQQAVTQVYVSDAIADYILTLVERTRTDRRLAVGVSPRGSLALFKGSQAMAAVNGRDWVAPEDVTAVLVPVLINRVIVTPEFAARGATPRSVIEELQNSIPVPGYEEEEQEE